MPEVEGTIFSQKKIIQHLTGVLEGKVNKLDEGYALNLFNARRGWLGQCPMNLLENLSLRTDVRMPTCFHAAG